MKKWRKNLAGALKSGVAQTFIAARNKEEEDFRYMTQVMKSDPILKKEDFAGYLFIRKCDKRPEVRWLDEVRMTNRQESQCDRLIKQGATVWCGAELVASGATAILMKIDLTWIMLYEDGSVNRGDMPMIRYQWPVVHAESKAAAKQKSLPLASNAMGGVVMTRYKAA